LDFTKILPGDNKKQPREKTQSAKHQDNICVTVEPGICGFPCRITARMLDKQTVLLKISESECKQIQRLSKRLKKITMPELFAPITRNPVYLAAQQSGCHPSCVIPAAVLKAVEAAMDMALPRDVHIQIVPCREQADR
jgi:hypothetical protein